jgi:hypothetical protein
VEYEKISNAQFLPQRIDHKPTIYPCARKRSCIRQLEKKRKVWARGNLFKVAYPLCANAEFCVSLQIQASAPAKRGTDALEIRILTRGWFNMQAF